MCTLVVFPGVSKNHPLVIAANRDEVPTRPSETPRHLNDAVFAPRDLKRGGTWIGFSKRGFAVAITNRDRGSDRKGSRSRGLIVTACLNASSREEALLEACRLPPWEYSGYHLLLADKDGASLIVNDGETYAQHELGRTMHVITSFGTEPGHCARDAMIRTIVTPEIADDREALERLLSFHGPGPEDGTCAHGDGVRMETIFSAVAQMPADARTWHLRWRSGRPCSDPRWTGSNVPMF